MKLKLKKISITICHKKSKNKSSNPSESHFIISFHSNLILSIIKLFSIRPTINFRMPDNTLMYDIYRLIGR